MNEEYAILEAVSAAMVVECESGIKYMNVMAKELLSDTNEAALLSALEDEWTLARRGLAVSRMTNAKGERVYTITPSENGAKAEQNLGGINNILAKLCVTLAIDGAEIIRCDSCIRVLGRAKGRPAAKRKSFGYSEKCIRLAAEMLSTPEDIFYCEDTSLTINRELGRCLRESGCVSVAICPICFSDGKIFGILICDNSETRTWSYSELEYIGSMCRYIKSRLAKKYDGHLDLRSTITSSGIMSALYNNENIILATVDSDFFVTALEGKALSRMEISPHDYIGHSIYELSPEIDMAGIIEKLNNAHSGNLVVEIGKFWFDVYCSPASEGNGAEGFLAVMIDITENVAMREEVTRINSSMDVAAFSLRAGFWTQDIVTGGIIWDEGCYYLWGLQPGEVNIDEQTLRTIFPAGDYERFYTELSDTINDPHKTYFKFRFKPVEQGGAMRYIESKCKVQWENGEPVRVVGITTDITESIEMEEKLAYESQLKDASRDISLICAYSANVNEGIRSAIGVAASLFGSDSAALFVSDDECNVWRSLALWTTDEEEEEQITIPLVGLSAYGVRLKSEGYAVLTGETIGTIPRETMGDLVFMVPKEDEEDANLTFLWLGARSDGRSWSEDDIDFLRMFTGVLRMALRRRRIEDELKQAATDAEAGNRAKSEFLSSMSHEIRTPINAVLGMMRIALDSDDIAEVRSCLHKAEASGLHLLGIINDILDISRIEAGKMELAPVNFNLSDMISNVCNMISFAADAKKLSFVCTVEQGLPEYLYGDEKRLSQVMINLLNNAVKFTNKGSVRFDVGMDNGALRFVVTDTGIGIKREDRGKLFMAFERLDNETSRKTEGSGLGLLITKSIVDSMGGAIDYNSAYGEGTSFTVRIPFKEGNGEKARERSSLLGLFAPSAEVLAVDDNEVNLIVTEKMLRRFGVVCDRAESGEKALEMVKVKDYDIVLMDHMMPGMDGLETCLAIRRLGGKYSSLVIIALTANAVLPARNLFLSNGMDDFLSKPIEPALLEKLLIKWLPESKVEIKEAAQSMEPNDPGELSELSRLIDEQSARERFGSDEFFMQALGLVRANIESTLDRLGNLLEGSDFRGFKVEAHGIKGALASISAGNAVALAKEMEDIADRGDKAALNYAMLCFDGELRELGKAIESRLSKGT